MLIYVTRIMPTDIDTIGHIEIEGIDFFCDSLEPVDRGLDASMSLADIMSTKIPKITAIPTGEYEVKMLWSNHFARMMPHIIDIPGFEDVMFHWLNKPADTEGCVGCGILERDGFISHSHTTFDDFLPFIVNALNKGESVTVRIRKLEIPTAPLQL